MQESDISKLVNQESFLNYCLQSNMDDVAYWENWLTENPEYKKHAEEFKISMLLVKEPIVKKVIDHDFQLLRESIAVNLSKRHPLTRKINIWPRMIAIAATIAIIVAGLHFFYQYNVTNSKGSVRWANDIKPGGHKAVLKLANGNSVVLNDSKKGVVFRTGKMLYDDGTVLSSPASATIQMLTVQTPRGGQYETTLPDGTHVWLNAASSITFPSEFSGSKRRIRLIGEAYMEVAKDKNHPFIVESGKQEIEVLGTHFNVNSYADESAIVTTLLEGSVKIKAEQTNIVLKPGERSQFISGEKMLKTDVNASEAIAWKNGKFIFMDEALGSIMRKISRWYDVDVIYQGADPNERYWGSVSKYENVSKVLEKLELTGSLHFKISGNKLYVIQ